MKGGRRVRLVWVGTEKGEVGGVARVWREDGEKRRNNWVQK